MASSRISPKKEESEPDVLIPEPQPRVPDPTHYREAIGPKRADDVIYKMPKDGRPFYNPIVRRQNPNSVYDDSLWPASIQAKRSTINKTKSHDQFLLNDNEMADLYYLVTSASFDRYEQHRYLVSEVEYRAWEVYGGPTGFMYAMTMHNTNRAERRRNSKASGTCSPCTPKKASPKKFSGPSSPGSAKRTPRTPIRFKADPY